MAGLFLGSSKLASGRPRGGWGRVGECGHVTPKGTWMELNSSDSQAVSLESGQSQTLHGTAIYAAPLSPPNQPNVL